MTNLVTGATGFVGSAVARALLADGEAVRVLVRASSDTRNVDGLDVERAIGDLSDPASLKAAVAGCRRLYHVAADYRLWIPDPASVYAINVDGSRDLLLAAAEAGVEKRSKFVAEEAVKTLIDERGVPAVIVNPSAPVGPRDIKPTPTGKMIVDAAAGRMPAYTDTGLNVVHVDDCADGHLRAMRNGRVGERYILGGENLTLKQILDRIAAMTGRAGPRFKLPHALVTAIAYAAEGGARLMGGREPLVTIDSARMARHHMFFSSAKAATDLDYHPRPVDVALTDAIAWFRDNGYLDNTKDR
jgi:dihydroflavonol-4-reductase